MRAINVGAIPLFCPICDAPIDELARIASDRVDAVNPYWGGRCDACGASIDFEFEGGGVLMEASR